METGGHELAPAFDFAAHESRVLLAQGEARLQTDAGDVVGPGEVHLEFLPRAAIRIDARFQSGPVVAAMMETAGEEKLPSFFFNGRRIDGFALNLGGNVAASEMVVTWRPRSEPVIQTGDDSTRMTRVVFHVCNFPQFVGLRRTHEQRDTTTHVIEHLDLSCNEWQVELKSLPETVSNIKALRADGGCRLTHVGSLQRVDGSPFTGKEADNVLKAVRFFLSFARGGWCDPVCAVGLDASNNRVWESWSSPREPWHTPLSWCDPHNASQLVDLFPRFMARWADDSWQEALHEVIYWYLNANQPSRGIDAGIILIQAAVERLSYEFAVRDKQLVTVNGFKSLWASDKFRLLFSSLEIPLDIPDETPELQGLARNNQMGWIDAPHAITEIRNSLIHPEHKRRSQLRQTYYEAWNLGLWYLEMCVLAVCEYSGNYNNRLKLRFAGQVEAVPWSQ